MIIFTLENEANNITAHASIEEAAAVTDAVRFENEADWAKVAADWPASRFVAIWNSLPGVTPVKKFTNRDAAIRRIWSAIANLGEPAPVAPVPDTAPATTDVATTESGAAEQPTPDEAAQPAEIVTQPRQGSKAESVLRLLRRHGGVTTEELISATGWQAHSVRGFLSGTVRKKMALSLASAKREDGKRVYSIPA